ncbi:MAG: TolC family protein [Dysgonamonadaceae bacterium]|jgi:outer membrane protein TolC|nr:TolC family protein [Dysgonamonadaceae bacterium]
MKKLIISVLLGITISPAFSQNVLTLEQCREMALKNNAEIKNVALSVKAAEEQKKEAFTKFFPSVSGTATGVVFDKPLMTTEVETGYPEPNNKAQVDMIQNNIVGGVMATQPIFAGGQIVNGNRLAKAGVEISKLQREISENEVLLTTEKYFWQLISLKEKMKTIENSEIMLNRILSDVKVAVDAGLTTRNDLLRVELELNKLQSGKFKAENGLQILKTAFAQHIGLENDNFDIEMPDINLHDFENLSGFNGDVENRPEYRLLEKSVDIAKLQVKMETGKHLPTVAIGAGYNWVRMDAGQQTKTDKNFGMALAIISLPISDWWGSSYAIKRKKLELQKAENTRNEKVDLLRLQMQKIRNELNEAYQQIALAKKSIQSAEENLKISEDNYNARIMILSDLLEAQNLVQQAQDQYAESIAAYFVKLAEWKQIIE